MTQPWLNPEPGSRSGSRGAEGRTQLCDSWLPSPTGLGPRIPPQPGSDVLRAYRTPGISLAARRSNAPQLALKERGAEMGWASMWGCHGPALGKWVGVVHATCRMSFGWLGNARRAQPWLSGARVLSLPCSCGHGPGPRAQPPEALRASGRSAPSCRVAARPAWAQPGECYLLPVGSILAGQAGGPLEGKREGSVGFLEQQEGGPRPACWAHLAHLLFARRLQIHPVQK